MADVLVLTILSAMLAACFWYCFSRAATWSPAEIPSPSLVFDYVLYFGALTWSVELTSRTDPICSRVAPKFSSIE